MSYSLQYLILTINVVFNKKNTIKTNKIHDKEKLQIRIYIKSPYILILFT